MNTELQQQIAQDKAKDFCEKHGLREHFIEQDLTRAFLSAIERATEGKPFGYDCPICSEPINDSQPTEHTDDGLAHSGCCTARPQRSDPLESIRHTSNFKPCPPLSEMVEPLQRSERKCSCDEYDPRGAIRDPDCPVHDDHGEERSQHSEQQEQDLRQLAVDVCQLVHNSSTNAQAADWIYERLNAALPVRGALDLARNRILELEDALTAERESYNHRCEQYDLRVIERDQARKSILTAQKQFTAERQRTETAGVLANSYKHEAAELRQQLLSALAAIEKAKEVMSLMHKATLQPSGSRSEAELGRESYLAFKKFIDLPIDLSLLHEHDDQVRKPLVDALDKYMVAMDGLYSHNAATRSAVVQYFGTLHPPTAIDALAKVKENK